MYASRESLRVLIADDEPLIANTLAQIVNLSGFQAKAVYSGEDAVTHARELKPDVLITDVVMSGITGIEAAIQILETLPACKIILFSGQAATLNLLKEARADGYGFEILPKPVNPQTLIDLLKIPALS